MTPLPVPARIEPGPAGRPASGPLRVLVVDDSPTVRSMLADLLEADPALTVVGVASDGAAAVDQTVRLRPDVVVMDILMPGTDGYAATRRIMVDVPTPVVLVTAAVDPRSTEVGLQAMQAGALAVLPKPGGDGPAAVAFAARIRALADVQVIRRYQRMASSPKSPTVELTSSRTLPIAIAAVASSTGGPAALQRMLQLLPPDLAVPIVVVQHIVEGFTAGLVSWLDQIGDVRVRLAAHGHTLEAGVVHVAPDGAHLEVTRTGRAWLVDDPPVGGFRPSATRLFTSAAAAYGSRAAAVVLTGMGGDGLEGVRAVHAAGGLVLAQDEATSVVFGMPGVVVGAGLAHEVGPVDQLTSVVVRLAKKESS